ncbi:MAG: hypothetical protein ABSC06_22755, partial [Rhodopila sp.]
CSPPFDLSLAPQHAGDAMRITLFAPFYRGNLSFCRVEQIRPSSPCFSNFHFLRDVYITIYDSQ